MESSDPMRQRKDTVCPARALGKRVDIAMTAANKHIVKRAGQNNMPDASQSLIAVIDQRACINPTRAAIHAVFQDAAIKIIGTTWRR